jgi:hypothetical protein
MSADARIGVEEGAEERPSHRAIDNGNPTIYKPKWLVLDDINIDLLTFATFVASAISILFFRLTLTSTLILASGFILPLRLFFPRPKTPEGLVLITGASSGIGAELSYIFAEKGHDLILVGRNEEQLEAVKASIKKKYGKDAYTIASDLSLPGSAKKLYDHVTEKGFRVDVLVNGAGLGGAGDPFEQPIELAERMTHLNCTTLVQLTQLFGGDMIKRGKGWMLQVSSVGGKSHFAKVLSSFYRYGLTPEQDGWPPLVKISTTQPNTTSAPSPKLFLSNCAPILES